jgi:WhiB family redox-sensing transcriptional regulator
MLPGRPRPETRLCRPDEPLPFLSDLFHGAPTRPAPTDAEGIDVADTRRLPGPNADLWDWQLHAACRGMASSFFFHPEGERGPARARREAQAKAVCFQCPAMAACRDHALRVHEPYGIWGGLSESERAQLLTLSGAH